MLQTVHNVVVVVDPTRESVPTSHLPPTDGIHANDRYPTPELALSQRVKLLKPIVLLRVIDQVKPEQVSAKFFISGLTGSV